MRRHSDSIFYRILKQNFNIGCITTQKDYSNMSSPFLFNKNSERRDEMEPCMQIKAITEVTQQAINNSHRLDGHDKKIEEIEKTQTQILLDLNGNIKLLTVEMAGVKKDVQELKDKPVKRYETVVTVMITAVVSGLVGYVVSRLF